MNLFSRIAKSMKEPSLKLTLHSFFIVVLVGTVLLGSSFVYRLNYRSVFKLSATYFRQVESLMIDRLSTLINKAEYIAQISAPLLYKPDDFRLDNEELIRYMTDVLRYNPDLFSIYYSNPQGDWLQVMNIRKWKNAHFFYDPSRPIPPEVVFAIRWYHRSDGKLLLRWIYVDKDLKEVASETGDPAKFGTPDTDPRVRPWYVGALKADGNLNWTDIYLYMPEKIEGITLSKAIYGADQKLIGVVAVELPLEAISHFIEQIKIAETGHAFILNQEGKIIIPEMTMLSAAESGYKEYLRTKKEEFFFDYKGTKYVGTVHIFPATQSYKWLILLAAPADDFIGGFVKNQRIGEVFSLLLALLALLINTHFVKKMSRCFVTLANDADEIRELRFETQQRVISKIREIKRLDHSIASLGSAVHSFSRYIPKKVVKQLLEKEGDIKVGGEKTNIVVLFTDIEGFTTIAESYPTEKLMALLAEYFGILSNIIIQNEGTVDKYIGDSIMAFWGAPEKVSHAEWLSCKAALECHAAVKEFNQKQQEKGEPAFKTRFGLAAGEAIVGNVGTLERLNYTAIGDVVNTASRLQAKGKDLGTNILIDETIFQAVQEKLNPRYIDEVELKGKTHKIKVYGLLLESQDLK